MKQAELCIVAAGNDFAVKARKQYAVAVVQRGVLGAVVVSAEVFSEKRVKINLSGMTLTV